MPDTIDHDGYVARWLARAGAGRSPPELAELLERALNALYGSARQVLGDVTLDAIVDRVLFSARERHLFLSGVGFASGTFSCRKLIEVGPADAQAIRAGVRSLLTELLTVVGNLTADVLTSAFRTELSKLEKAEARDQ